jgi:hypothetical protein
VDEPNDHFKQQDLKSGFISINRQKTEKFSQISHEHLHGHTVIHAGIRHTRMDEIRCGTGSQNGTKLI